MIPHVHKSQITKYTVKPWTKCVNPEIKHGIGVHGSILYIDHCLCGATRESEGGGRQTIYGPWIEPVGKG